MAKCVYCNAEVEEVEENYYKLGGPIFWQGGYVCESCRRGYMVTGAQAEEVLEKWNDRRQKMRIEVNTFIKDGLWESRCKVLEEAREMVEAYDRLISDNDSYVNRMLLMLEIGDVFTATANLCEKLGFDAQRCVDMVETKNIIRGYYDTMDS